MKPERNSNKDYEKVKTDEFVVGEIEEVQYDKEHVFKGFEGKPDTKAVAARLKFKLDGYEYPHYSRWMKLNYGEKSNCYLKYLVPLVEGAKPDMDFDLDQLKGLKVKTLWNEKNGFQSIETIRPIGKKVVPLNVVDSKEPRAEIAETIDDETPF